MLREVAGVERLQRGPLDVDRVGIEGAEHVGRDGGERVLHVGARGLGRDVAERDPVDARGREIGGDVRQRLVQSDRERERLVERPEADDVDVDEHDAGVRELSAGRARHRADLGIEALPQARRETDAHAREVGDVDRRRAGDDGVEERHVGDRRAIGPMVSRVWLIGSTPAPS